VGWSRWTRRCSRSRRCSGNWRYAPSWWCFCYCFRKRHGWKNATITRSPTWRSPQTRPWPSWWYQSPIRRFRFQRRLRWRRQLGSPTGPRLRLQWRFLNPIRWCFRWIRMEPRTTRPLLRTSSLSPWWTYGRCQNSRSPKPW